jgi:DNA-binding NarL/FixJ family response regulator
MPLTTFAASQPTSVLLIDPERRLSLKLQDLLFGLFQESLDLATACSLRDGITYLCTHQVSLILISLAVSDYKGLDAVRALRLTMPDSSLIAYGAAVNETLRLDAIRAGAHEVLSIAEISADAFRLAAECAMARAKIRQMDTDSLPPGQPLPHHPAMSRLAHDLNNAITSVNGFADILLARLPADEPARTCAEQIKQAGVRAAALVKALAPPVESSSAPNSTATAQAA